MICLAACGGNGLPAADTGDLPSVENSAQERMDDAQLSESDFLVSNNNEPSSVEDSAGTEGAFSDPDANTAMEAQTSNEESEAEAIMQQNTFYVTIESILQFFWIRGTQKP